MNNQSPLAIAVAAASRTVKINTGMLADGIMVNSPPCAGAAAPLKKAIKRAEALARGEIMTITTAALDHLLAPYIRFGLLQTEYDRVTRATKYSGPTGVLVAMTVGSRHFCRRVSGPIILHQWVGRIKRQIECTTCTELTAAPVLGRNGYVCRPCKANETVHCHLENPRTGEKIEGSEFTL